MEVMRWDGLIWQQAASTSEFISRTVARKPFLFIIKFLLHLSSLRALTLEAQFISVSSASL